MTNYDVAIIGAGPAGLFAAYHILERTQRAAVALIDMGRAAQERVCCGNCSSCRERDRCAILCGVGGGGLFSDGKLVLDIHSGGKLDAVSHLNETEKEALKNFIVRTLRRFDGKSESSPKVSTEERMRWQERCRNAGLEIKHYDVLHMGTENLCHITTGFAAEIDKNPRVSFYLGCRIMQVEHRLDGGSVLYAEDGRALAAKQVIFAVGKTGSGWTRELFEQNGIAFRPEATYLGVRLEVPHTALEELFSYSFDPKIWAYYGERKVKTHCFCRHGEIVCSSYMGYPVVGGHTRFTAKNGTQFQPQKANFNVLASTHREREEICSILRRFSQLNPDGVSVQELSEFLCAGQAGDTVRCILDELDGSGAIIADFILRLGKIAPGILRSGRVYAPALEWFMDSVQVDSNMETSCRGWFAVGDGAGLSQGIVHSAATSMIAAEAVCRRIEG